MAHLTTSDGGRLLLAHTNLLGTYADCDVPLEHHDASRRHAHLWYEGGWFLRDLGSTNGTSVNGQHLSASETLSLEVGQQLCFGSPNGQRGDQFVVSDLDPPVPLLLAGDRAGWPRRELAVGETRIGSAGHGAVLQLNRTPAGLELLLRRFPGEARPRRLRDGDRFAWASVPYQVSLPGSRVETRKVPTLADCRLRFWTPRPEGPPEMVSVDFLDSQGEPLARFSCKNRKMKLLWVLANKRYQDRVEGKDPGDEGRVTRAELVELMGLPPRAAKPNLAFIQRGLRDLVRSACGVQDPDRIVELGEALDGTLLYRVGVAQLEITPQAQRALAAWNRLPEGA